jgi:hypothetical protein
MTPTSEPSTSEPQAKSRLGQFSLRKLLLAVVVLSLVLALVTVTRRYLASQQQLRQQGEELERLRAEAGYLVVGDRSKVHLLRVPTHKEDVWKWKIYLPETVHWQVRTAAGKIPRTGPVGMDSTSCPIGNGEITLEAFLERNVDGQSWLRISYGRSSGATTETTSLGLPADVIDDLFSAGRRETGLLGMRRATVVDVGGRIELLRVRRGSKLVFEDETTKRFETDDEPSGGVLVWLEPMT